jgi:hypothetical protein
LICPVDPADPDDQRWTLVSTRRWSSGAAAFQAFRPRWHMENDTYRERKEGWLLEAQRWGRDVDVQRGRVTLTCLAFNTAQVYLSRSGGRLAARGTRRLRRQCRPQLGAAPEVIYIGPAYAILSVEELLALVGRPVSQSLPLLRSTQPGRPKLAVLYLQTSVFAADRLSACEDQDRLWVSRHRKGGQAVWRGSWRGRREL